MDGIFYTVPLKYAVAGNRYSYLLFDSEYQLGTNLPMQEQSINMTSKYQHLAFTFIIRPTLKQDSATRRIHWKYCGLVFILIAAFKAADDDAGNLKPVLLKSSYLQIFIFFLFSPSLTTI